MTVVNNIGQLQVLHDQLARYLSNSRFLLFGSLGIKQIFLELRDGAGLRLDLLEHLLQSLGLKWDTLAAKRDLLDVLNLLLARRFMSLLNLALKGSHGGRLGVLRNLLTLLHLRSSESHERVQLFNALLVDDGLDLVTELRYLLVHSLGAGQAVEGLGPLANLKQVVGLHAVHVGAHLVLGEAIEAALGELFQLGAESEHATVTLLGVSLKAERIAQSMGTGLVELRLVLDAGGRLLGLLSLELFTGGTLLLADSLLHVHSVGPFSLHFEDENFEELFTLLSLSGSRQLASEFLRHLGLVASLLGVLECATQSMDLAHTVVMVARIVLVAQTILALARLDSE